VNIPDGFTAETQSSQSWEYFLIENALVGGLRGSAGSPRPEPVEGRGSAVRYPNLSFTAENAEFTEFGVFFNQKLFTRRLGGEHSWWFYRRGTEIAEFTEGLFKMLFLFFPRFQSPFHDVQVNNS